MDKNNPFYSLLSLLQEDMNRVDRLLNSRMKSSLAPVIPEVTNHLINAGGKRIRPLLTLAVAKMFDYSGHHHINLAATVEYIHTATLLHDDVIDESKKRRGKPTANMLWDNKLSVLVGDFLFSRAFQLMVETNSIRVLESLANASATISQSEVLQMTLAQDISTNQEKYLQVVRGKTAALFSAACEVGGIISEAKSSQIKSLTEYGDALGISFQIMDDYLDYCQSNENLGKNSGDDFRERKITLPVLLSLSKKNQENNSFWKRTIAKGNQRDSDFISAQKILREDKSLEETKEKAVAWSEIARTKLKLLPKGKINNFLNELTKFMTSRIT